MGGGREKGEPYRRSTIDGWLDDEGFIHCSYRDQVQGVADRFYRSRTDVLLLTIDTSKVEAEVRTENGFPHIYGPLPIESVVRAEPVAWHDDGRLLVNALLGEGSDAQRVQTHGSGDPQHPPREGLRNYGNYSKSLARSE